MRCTIGVAMLMLWALAGGPAYAVVGASEGGATLGASMLMVLTRSGPVAGFCSAIVIAQDAILTAAHCVPTGADIRAHYRDQAGRPVLLAVAAVSRHPGYRADAIQSRQRSIDLALIRLANPLPSLFRPAPLGVVATATPGESFRIAGFGLGREGDPGSSGELRTATVTARTPLSSVLLWAHDPAGHGTGACTGDSGGAVMQTDDGTVVAVIAWSAGIGRAQCGDLTQAIWIPPQRPWIDSVLSRWTPGP